MSSSGKQTDPHPPLRRKYSSLGNSKNKNTIKDLISKMESKSPANGTVTSPSNRKTVSVVSAPTSPTGSPMSSSPAVSRNSTREPQNPERETTPHSKEDHDVNTAQVLPPTDFSKLENSSSQTSTSGFVSVSSTGSGPPSVPTSPVSTLKSNKPGTRLEDETSQMIDSLTDVQRYDLLRRYCEAHPQCLQEVEQLIKKFAHNDHHILLDFKRHLDRAKQSGITKLLGTGTVDAEIASKAVALEYKKFWNSENRSEVDTASREEIDQLRKLASYVPKLVVRRFLNNPTPVSPPEIEHYSAAVMFADISGFTPLTEKMASLGAEGVEKLTSALNQYFDALIGTVYRHGGDIIKFAGDAILCLWPAASSKGLGGMILLACQCAMSLLHDLNHYKVPETDCVLELHIGLGAGEAGGVHVGGTQSRTEFFISGQVLEQVSLCEKQAAPGEAYVSAVAWLLVEKGALQGSQKGGPLANYRLDAIKQPLELPPPVVLPLLKDMEESMKAYIPPGVLRHIASGTKRWLAELRNVSVLFLNLTSPFKDSKLNELQNEIKEMQQIVYKFEGVVRQFMIDDKGSVLIVGFGLPPLAHENDAERAVETALEILAKLQELKVPCSIGVTTGKAFCGDVGTNQRREYAMVGDIVNLSARLMAAAKTGILCDADTFEAARNSDSIQFERQTPIKVKGKANPINVYIPKKKKKTSTNATLKQMSHNSTLVGREEEIKFLQKHFIKLRSQLNGTERIEPNQVVILEGDAGVGKSRVMHEIEGLCIKADMKSFTAMGNQLQNSTPYHAWIDVFETLLTPDGKVPEGILKKAGIQIEYQPLLNSILPLNLEEGPRIKQMSYEERFEITQNCLIKLLRHIVPRGSLILMENAHWFDSASWNLALAAATQLPACLIIVSLRPIKEGMPFQYLQLRSRDKTKLIQLKNLPESKTEELIIQLLKIKKIPENVAKEIHRKAQGNPFLTEAILNALRDNGGLQITKTGECVITADVQQAMPKDISGLMTSKVDRLAPNQQVLLKVASVIGQNFTFDMLGEILYSADNGETSKITINPADLKRDLRAIESAGLVVLESPDPNLSYSFANSLIRDVVYDLMLYSQRRQVHRNVVSFYQTNYEGRSAFYPLIANHLKSAEDMSSALEYFNKAGNTSLINYSNKEAIEFFKDAIQLSLKLQQEKTTDSITTERKLGQAYHALGQIEQAGAQYKKVLELMGIQVLEDTQKSKANMKKAITHNFSSEKTKNTTETPHRKREAVIALLGLAQVSYYKCNRSLATSCAAMALQIAEDTGSALLSETYAMNSLCCGINGENDNAVAFITKGTEAAGEKHLDVVKTVEQKAGMYYAGISKWNEAEACLSRAIELSKTVGNLKAFEECSVFLGTIHFLRGDFTKSIAATQQALDSSSRGDAQIQMLATNAQARNMFVTGDFVKCLDSLRDVKIAFESVGTHDVSAQINFYSLNALMLFRKKEVGQCWIFAEQAFNVITKTEPTAFFTFFGYFVLPEIYIRLLQEQKLWKDGEFTLSKKDIQSRAEKSVAALAKFAQLFSFALPRSMLWAAALKLLNGKEKKAEAEFSKALETAKTAGLTYEEAFIMFAKGVITKNGDDIVNACKLFPEIKSLGIDLTTLKLKLLKV